jgi:DNA-binding CsgD family transcriptional regulator
MPEVILSKRQREIVLLVGRDGLSWSAVARAMQCHPSTVRAHVKRITCKLAIDRKPREAMVVAYYTAMPKNAT